MASTVHISSWLAEAQCCEYLAGESETEALHPPLRGIINEPKGCGGGGGGRRSRHTHPLPPSGQTDSEPGFPHSSRGILNRRDRETSHLLSQWTGVFPAESKWEENTELGIEWKDPPLPHLPPPVIRTAIPAVIQSLTQQRDRREQRRSQLSAGGWMKQLQAASLVWGEGWVF